MRIKSAREQWLAAIASSEREGDRAWAQFQKYVARGLSDTSFFVQWLPMNAPAYIQAYQNEQSAAYQYLEAVQQSQGPAGQQYAQYLQRVSQALSAMNEIPGFVVLALFSVGMHG